MLKFLQRLITKADYWKKPTRWFKQWRKNRLLVLAEIQKTGSVIDMLRFLNQEETIRVLHDH